MHKYDKPMGVLNDADDNDNELNCELRWSQLRKLSMAHGRSELKANDPAIDPGWNDLCDKVQRGGPFYKSLTPVELENALAYAWRYPNQAWQLNQSAAEHAQCSNRQYLHTLIRNCGIIFTEHPDVVPPRWLTATEMWLGLPV